MIDIITGTVEPHLFSDFLAALYQSGISSKMSQILFGFEGRVVAQPLKKSTDINSNAPNNFILAIARVALRARANLLPLKLEYPTLQLSAILNLRLGLQQHNQFLRKRCQILLRLMLINVLWRRPG